MPEAARILALLSGLFFFVAAAIWVRALRGPLLQRLDGARASNAEPATIAIQVLLLALGLSAIAAVLAIAGWIFP